VRKIGPFLLYVEVARRDPTAIRVKAWRGVELVHSEIFKAAPANEHSADLHYETWKKEDGITEVVKEERYGSSEWETARREKFDGQAWVREPDDSRA